jgi:glycosyltransferase involved in cell wall biosynthesis
MAPNVSIIIPNYNHQKFLQQRLDSVFNQTYQDFEVIILDDASTDESLNLLVEYKNHPKVTFFLVNETNSGSPFIQWKKGIELAKGKFIWIAESDDFCALNFLETMMTILENEDKTCLAFSNSLLKNLITRKEEILITNIKSGVYDNFDNKFLYDWFINYSNFRIVNASSCVFRKASIKASILEKITQHRYSGDKLFWTNLLLQNPYFGYHQDPINIHTFHENTTRSIATIKTNNIRNNEILEIYKICNFDKKNQSSINWKREYGKRMLLSFFYSILLFQKPEIKNFIIGFQIVKFDSITWKRIHSLLKKDRI